MAWQAWSKLKHEVIRSKLDRRDDGLEKMLIVKDRLQSKLHDAGRHIKQLERLLADKEHQLARLQRESDERGACLVAIDIDIGIGDCGLRIGVAVHRVRDRNTCLNQPTNQPIR